jgi:hypothetical protein
VSGSIIIAPVTPDAAVPPPHNKVERAGVWPIANGDIRRS